MKRFFRTHRRSPVPYIVEIGTTGFIMTGSLALIGGIIDVLRPGTFYSYIAPQHLVTALVLFGVASLVGNRRRAYGVHIVIALAAVAGVTMMLAFRFAYDWLATVDADGTWIAGVAALAVVLPFFLFRRFGADDAH